MAKIMVLAPNQEMARYTEQIAAKENLSDCEVKVIETSQSVTEAGRPSNANRISTTTLWRRMKRYGIS